MATASTSSVPLDHLPFGEASALAFDDVAACTAFLETVPERPSVFEPIGSAHGFRIRMRTVPLPDLTLLAGASTAKAVVHESSRASLVIPFGVCGSVVRVGRAEHRWASPHDACYIPAGEQIEAVSTAGSFLRLDLDEGRLAAIAAGMAAHCDRPPTISEIRTTRTVPLRPRGTNWLGVMRAICATVDALACDPARVAHAGVDDLVMRTIAMMLFSDQFAGVPPTAAVRGWHLDPLIERIMANLTGRVTMSTLEAWSGRSARALQVAFKKRFGIGPIEWVRQRRLELFRTRLLAADGPAKIGSLARECGIVRMATLSAEYTRLFGERPSQTRARSNRRRRSP